MERIEYTVNDEPQSTEEKTLTAKQILENAGIDPETNYLIQIMGVSKKDYKDNPEDVIHMHPKMRFISNFTGPTTVS